MSKIDFVNCSQKNCPFHQRIMAKMEISFRGHRKNAYFVPKNHQNPQILSKDPKNPQILSKECSKNT